MDEFKTYLKQSLIKLLDRKNPNLELEVRLGNVTDAGFKTDLGEDQFNQFLDKLKQEYNNAVTYAEFVEFKHKSKFRIRLDADKNIIEAVKKKRVSVRDFELPESGFDLRVGVSLEAPLKNVDKPRGMMIRKHRWQVQLTSLTIDLTKVSFKSGDLLKSRYQLELEVNLQNIGPDSLDQVVNQIESTLERLIITHI